MTAEQIDLASKIRSLKIMFSDTECDKIPPEAKNLVQGMTKKLVDSLHKAAIFFYRLEPAFPVKVLDPVSKDRVEVNTKDTLLAAI